MPSYNERVVTVPLAGGQILDPSPKRLAIIFPGPPTNRYTLTTRPGPVIDQGITQYPACIPWQLIKAEVGQMVEKAWFGISAVADQTLVIGEVYE